MLSDIFAGIKLVLDLVTRQGIERRELADLLDKIADSMKLAIEPALNGHPISEQHVKEFLIYCRNFDKIVEGVLTDKTRNELKGILDFAAANDRAYIETQFEKMTCLGGSVCLAIRASRDFPAVIDGIAQLKAYANILRAHRGKV